MEQKKGLLVVRCTASLAEDQRERIVKHVTPLADALDLSIAVVGNGDDVQAYYDPAPMVEALKEATRALNAAADRLNVEHSSLPRPVIARPSPDQGDSYAEFSNPPVRLRR